MFDPQRLAQARVLVVGDVMLDRYWFGHVERISPEAPVPIIRVDYDEERPGGAANVAMNVVSLGAGCTLASVVGDDEQGAALSKLLGSTPIDTRLAVDPQGKTVTKLRMVAQNQQLIRADFDGEPGEQAMARCLDIYEAALDTADVVVMSDYGKGGMRRIERMIEAAAGRGKPVYVDPKGADFERYRNATVVTPNLREFEAVVGRVKDDEDLRKKAVELARGLNISSLLVTRSDRGMVLVGGDGRWFDCPSSAREVYDVSGAGDTVIAAFAVGRAMGLSEEDAVRTANAAAGVVVGRFGTATATLDEVNAVLGSGRERGES